MADTRTMKSIVVRKFGEPEVLNVEDVPVFKPGSGQVLVKVFAAGVNPVETYVRSGNYASTPDLPWTPGKDGAGIVEAVGENVSNIKANERIWLSGSHTGTYSQYCLASQDDVHPLPETFTFDQGAGLWVPYATAYHALFHIGEAPKQGGTILVHGASGGVGIATLQWAKQIPGIKVFGTAGSEEGLKLVLKNGADAAFNHREAGYNEKILAATDSKGVDIIVEMVANVNLNIDLQLLSKFGRVCVVGNRGSIDGFNARFLMQRRSSIRGVMLGNVTEDEKKEIIQAIYKSLKEKKKLIQLLGRIIHLQKLHRPTKI